MRAAAPRHPGTAATSSPDTSSLTPDGAAVLAPQDHRPRAAVRSRKVAEVRWHGADGAVESVLYRRLPAALRHAARLREQGWPVVVAVAYVTVWTVVA